jgi:hypothetical protein
MRNKVRWAEIHLHGHCKVADEEVKPFGIGRIRPSEGEMRECDGEKNESTHDQMASTSRSRVIKMSQTRKERAATEGICQ